MISTVKATRPGAVIFTGDKESVALTSDDFELVIHALPGEPTVRTSRAGREAYVKPFLPVKSLSEARERAAAFGGRLSPAAEEWKGRGFRACEAIDPDGIPFNSEKMHPDSWPLPIGTEFPIHD